MVVGSPVDSPDVVFGCCCCFCRRRRMALMVAGGDSTDSIQRWAMPPVACRYTDGGGVTGHDLGWVDSFGCVFCSAPPYSCQGQRDLVAHARMRSTCEVCGLQPVSCVVVLRVGKGIVAGENGATMSTSKCRMCSEGGNCLPAHSSPRNIGSGEQRVPNLLPFVRHAFFFFSFFCCSCGVVRCTSGVTWPV